MVQIHMLKISKRSFRIVFRIETGIPDGGTQGRIVACVPGRTNLWDVSLCKTLAKASQHQQHLPLTCRTTGD